MRGAWAVSAESFQVLGRAIAEMAVEAVLRVVEREETHGGIASGFGEDGCGGDAGEGGVAANQRNGGEVIGEGVTVDEDRPALEPEAGCGEKHGAHGGAEDVGVVYFLR